MGELFSFLIVIGIIIFIHEFGHFSMAKLFGIPVATFSLGFGPKLFGFRFRETEYKVSAIPLGGYVKIHGMEDQEATPDDPNSFYNRPRYQRFLVLFMGVGFNMLLAIVLITTALMLGRQVSQSIGLEGKIGVVKVDSPAAKAGLQPGDVIVEMKGKPTPTWEEIIYATLLNPNEMISVKVKRGDQILEKNVFVEKEKVNNLGYIGVAPETTVIVSQLTDGKPAAKAGLKVGDRIESIDGRSSAILLRLFMPFRKAKETRSRLRFNDPKAVIPKARPSSFRQRSFMNRMLRHFSRNCWAVNRRRIQKDAGSSDLCLENLPY